MKWHINFMCYHEDWKFYTYNIMMLHSGQLTVKLLSQHKHPLTSILFLHFKKTPDFQPERYLQVGKFSSY